MATQKQSRNNKKVTVGEGRASQKVRTADELELLSMILAEDPPLRERVLRLLEQQLGKRELIKLGNSNGE